MQPSQSFVVALVVGPFVAAALTPLVFRVAGERTAYYAAAVALVAFGAVFHLLLSGVRGSVGVPWAPSLGTAFVLHVDGLALLVSLLATGVGVLIFVYSRGYMHMHGRVSQSKYYATLLAFMGSMLGVALAGDLLVLFVFWELTSVTSFLLIGHETGSESSLAAARKAMVVTVAGGLFMIVGFLLLAWGAGRAGESTYRIAELVARAPAVRAALSEAGLLVPAIGLVAVGVATKSAQVPVHFWLPDAMEAPTPVSAFLHSATMVKAGVYLAGRLRPVFLPESAHALPPWTVFVATLGLVTMAVTAVLAVRAGDIKELLAYSTASQLGLIIAGFGLAETVGAEAGAFHILNHAAFKAALFLVAGIVAHEAGTRAMDDLGGLRRDLPVTAAVATVAALSMAGIPPFGGFYSKELLFDAAYETAHAAGGLAWLFPALAVFGSVFTVLYSVRFLRLFWGPRPDGLGEVHAPSLPMRVPAAVLGLLVLGLTAAPQATIDTVVAGAFAATVPGDPQGFSVYFPTELSPPVAMSATALGLGAVAVPATGRIRTTVDRTLRGPVRSDWWYHESVDGLATVGRRLTSVVQTGLLRTYVTWWLATAMALAALGYLATGTTVPAVSGLGPGVTIPIAVVGLVAVLGAAAVLAAPSHVAGVLTLSILGFMVAILYLLADAPDLALTQLVVETLVLVVFLLVLHRLPAFYGSESRLVVARDAVLSVGVGATVAVTVLLTTAASPNDALARFLVERAGLPEEHGPVLLGWGGGGNIVNVILVDFRGLDTLGEISVVAMAALGVLTLLRMGPGGEEP